jgi:hypothetical protein
VCNSGRAQERAAGSRAASVSQLCPPCAGVSLSLSLFLCFCLSVCLHLDHPCLCLCSCLCLRPYLCLCFCLCFYRREGVSQSVSESMSIFQCSYQRSPPLTSPPLSLSLSLCSLCPFSAPPPPHTPLPPQSLTRIYISGTSNYYETLLYPGPQALIQTRCPKRTSFKVSGWRGLAREKLSSHPPRHLTGSDRL